MEKIFEILEIIGNKTAKSKPEKTIAEHTASAAKFFFMAISLFLAINT